MPSYAFDIKDGNGTVLSTITMQLPVDQRDCVIIERQTVPQVVRIIGSVDNLATVGGQIAATLKKYEAAHGTAAMERRVGYSSKTLKAVHGI